MPSLLPALLPFVLAASDAPSAEQEPLTWGQKPEGELPRVEPEILCCGFDRDAVQREIRLHREDWRACYTAALTLDPELQGRATLRFSWGDAGVVDEAEVALQPGLQAVDRRGRALAGLGECLEQVALTLVLPPSACEGGRTTVSYPLLFSPEPG